MNQSADDISFILSDSIKEGKWVEIHYENKNKEKTCFWIAIYDVLDDGRLCVEMYNHNLGDKLEKGRLEISRILSARVINMSTYDGGSKLIEKLNDDPMLFPFLKYEKFNKNVLGYLTECIRLDNDPYQNDYQMVEGIDVGYLRRHGKVFLNDEQINSIVNGIYKNDIDNEKYINSDFVISTFSIDIKKKKYIVIYYRLCFNPKNKTLEIKNKPYLNQSFLIDGYRCSLSKYTELDKDEFFEIYKDNPDEAISLIRENLSANEVIDTRPDMMILSRNMQIDFESIAHGIDMSAKENNLCAPLKAFFGDLTLHDKGKRQPKIVLYDDKVNPDQMLVIYYAMKNPVTYVQGPPGTGKTQTLFNVVVSSYYNNRKTMVTCMNNLPVDGIIEKLHFINDYGQDVPFPFLRLGNNEVVLAALEKIKQCHDTEYKGKPDKERIDRIKEDISKKYSGLVELITAYEKNRVNKEKLDWYSKLRNDTSGILASTLVSDMNNLQKEINDLGEISSEKLLEKTVTVGKDKYYSQYLWFSSIEHLNRLKRPEYSELMSIVNGNDNDEKVKQFNNWCLKDKNMKLLTDVFPIIFTTNISARRLGTSFLFDMIVMDEAGQSPIGASLIPLSKAKSALLVGDEDQLKPVILLDKNKNQELMEKYKIRDSYDYTSESILSSMEENDKITKKIVLRYHYRCGRKIIGFSNKYFYDNKLILSKNSIPGELKLIDCKSNARCGQNQSVEEAYKVVDYVKKSGTKNTVIITPFVNQSKLINDLLDSNGITDVRANTIHKVQGGEADTVIISTAITSKTPYRTAEWLDKHSEIINVAVSRAKKNLIVCSDDEVVKKLYSKDAVISQLIDYVKSNGGIEVVPPLKNVEIGKSNASMTEDEFYKTMTQIMSVEHKVMVKRNVPSAVLFGDDSTFEFDSVIYERVMLKFKPIMVFEFDGGEHYEDADRMKSDKRKEALCRGKGIKLFRLPNKYAKEYEYILMLIKKFMREPVTEDIQLSLL